MFQELELIMSEELGVMAVADAAKALGVSRLLIYRLVREGSFPAVRLGRRILIPTAALKQRLQAAADGGRCHG